MTHLEETLERDIARISGKVQEMASLVDLALNDAMRSLADGNRQLAYLVIVRDQRIDEIEKELDRLTLEFIVRQQPVARHLRFAYAAIKVNTELERVGDYAESIARQVLALSDMEFELPPDLFAEISECAIPMVRGAVDAFRRQDLDLAKATVAAEETADRLRHQLSRELVRLFQAGALPPEAVPPLQNISKSGRPGQEHLPGSALPVHRGVREAHRPAARATAEALHCAPLARQAGGHPDG